MNSLTFEARVSTDHFVPVPDEVPAGTLVRIHLEEMRQRRGGVAEV
jgi:hypothetical protein